MVDLKDKGFDHEEDYGTYGQLDPVPVGEYKAMIVESEDFETKSGSGVRTQLIFEIIDGEHKGRKLYENLNLVNENHIAVRIARAELKAICAACGGLKPQRTEELHQIPMVLVVGQKVREDTGDLQNTIKRYKSLADEAVASTAAASTEKPRAAPWKQKG